MRLVLIQAQPRFPIELSLFTPFASGRSCRARAVAMGLAFAVLVLAGFGLGSRCSSALSKTFRRTGLKQDSIQRHTGQSNRRGTIGLYRIGGYLEVDLNSFNGVWVA